jgi:hypothetical protein
MAKSPGASRSKIISAIRKEIGDLASGPAEAGAFEKNIHTREGHEKGTAHEKGSLIDKLDAVRNVVDPAIAKTVSGGVISPRAGGVKKPR